jgi:uncharacterized protein (DUF1919 family)
VEHEGEKEAELPTLGEVARIESNKESMSIEQNDALSKRTLKIWDVPSELANKFIATARGSYANKSWLYLQDLIRKADQYDMMVSSGKLEEHERRIAQLEVFAERLDKALSEEPEPEKKAKKPKHFGDVNE